MELSSSSSLIEHRSASLLDLPSTAMSLPGYWVNKKMMLAPGGSSSGGCSSGSNGSRGSSGSTGSAEEMGRVAKIMGELYWAAPEEPSDEECSGDESSSTPSKSDESADDATSPNTQQKSNRSSSNPDESGELSSEVSHDKASNNAPMGS